MIAPLLLALAATGPATTITMPGRFFDPPRATVVAGDTVTFRNADLTAHDVRIADGLLDSGPLGRSGSWSQRFDRPGSYPYVCTLHAFMGGQLEVVAATLSASPATAVAGEPLRLSGRAPAGSAAVELVRFGADGRADSLGSAPADADGHFSFTTAGVAGARYVARSSAGDSAPLAPDVRARVDVHLRVAHGRVHVHTAPAAGGLRATLEHYDRWRYRWRPDDRARLDDDGAAMLAPGAARAYARVVLRRARRGPILARSGVVRLPGGRPVRDPETGGAPGHAPGHAPAHGGH